MGITTSLIRSLQVLLAGRKCDLELGTEVSGGQPVPALPTDGFELISATKSPIYTWLGVQLGTATSADYELWVFITTSAGVGTWFRVPNANASAVTLSEIDRYPLSGATRAYVRITDADGTVTPVYAPCNEE